MKLRKKDIVMENLQKKKKEYLLGVFSTQSYKASVPFYAI